MCLRCFTISGLLYILMCTVVDAAANTDLVNINIQLTPVIPSTVVVNIPGPDIHSPVCVVQNVNLVSRVTCVTGQAVPLGVYVNKQFLGSFGRTNTDTNSSKDQSQLATPLTQSLHFEKQEDGSLEFLVNF